MSTEQSEGETQTAPAVTANSQADITQQATTPTPTTTTQRVKNPKRVAAGKMSYEKTRLAREKQKALAEAYMEMENNKAKAATEVTEPAPSTEGGEKKNSGLSINQWLAVGSLVVSLAGIYLKREELKAAFSKKTPEPAPASVEPEPARSPQRKGLRKMD